MWANFSNGDNFPSNNFPSNNSFRHIAQLTLPEKKFQKNPQILDIHDLFLFSRRNSPQPWMCFLKKKNHHFLKKKKLSLSLLNYKLALCWKNRSKFWSLKSWSLRCLQLQCIGSVTIEQNVHVWCLCMAEFTSIRISSFSPLFSSCVFLITYSIKIEKNEYQS